MPLGRLELFPLLVPRVSALNKPQEPEGAARAYTARLMNVQLIVASPAERLALENLMQLYIHDFSEHWAGRDEGDLDADGRFADYPLDAYWSEPTHIPLLLHVDDKLAGFALLNNVPHAGRPIDRNMAEFFIARKYRRSGIGSLLAHQIFNRYPGRWEVAIARRNAAALAFWRRAIVRHPLVVDFEELDIAKPAWNGPVISFRVRQAN
jgi:predicted acetyltransferase